MNDTALDACAQILQVLPPANRRAVLDVLCSRFGTACWHCLDVLIEVERPRCYRCPSECDDPDCSQPGCASRLSQGT